MILYTLELDREKVITILDSPIQDNTIISERKKDAILKLEIALLALV